jgi:hypothetical protein
MDLFLEIGKWVLPVVLRIGSRGVVVLSSISNAFPFFRPPLVLPLQLDKRQSS